MPLNFFEPEAKTTTRAGSFGLCDDETLPGQDPTPAYLNETDPSIWIGEVENAGNEEVNFYPVDNHLMILKEDGTPDKKCDCLLHYQNSVHFIELKDRQYRGWTSIASKQLQATINHFFLNYPASRFGSIKAQICNKERPNFSRNYMTLIERFEDDTNVELIIERLVKIS